MRKRVITQLPRCLGEQCRSVRLRHSRRRIFAGARALEGITAGLNLTVQVARLSAGAAQLVKLIVEGLKLAVGDAPVLHGKVLGDLLAVALLVMALGQEVRR